MDSDRPPPLKGVVIITLPPPENPSLGKTITAFTLYGPVPSRIRETPPARDQEEARTPLPIQLPRNTELRSFFRRLLHGSRRAIVGFLGIAIFAYILYSSFFSSALRDFRGREDEEKKPGTFIFPMIPKWRNDVVFGGDVELKLGRFVDFESKRKIVGPFDKDLRDSSVFNSNKLVASKSGAVDSSTLLPVKGNVYPDGLYYTYILVGSPPRRYHVDIDTGSDLTWIQCDAPCTSCGKGANPLYKPKSSKIVPPRDSLCKEVQKQRTEYCPTCKQCDYEIEYADHSSSMGVLARDELYLRAANGSLGKLNAVFGCAYDQQGLLLNSLSKTDGIMGLSRSSVSLPSQLASNGMINNVIGHCLTSDAVGGGYMFLGEEFMPNWGMQWIPMLNIPSTNSYQSSIMKMKYGSTSLSLGPLDGEVDRVVFDSGSSYTYFTKEAYSDLVLSLKEVTGSGLVLDASDPTLPFCWRSELPIRSLKEVKHFFKAITLQFGSKWWILSTKLHIPPESYLIINNMGNVCLGILDGSEVLDRSTTVIGDISLRGKLVVYDNVNGRIGWVQSDCIRPQRYKTPFFST
ncbi:hypothetical protein SAY86_025086 [Trapa natans]|uniref:Peptidase A1 domain-containing protein n=1 Tax=Trapa natans TaxID=22666 RepID=A0AAN7M789_TRANT|nr:hypothetical protein SAY86_025086 [Trapa natans]